MDETPLVVPIGAQFESDTYQLLDESGVAIPLTGFTGRGEALPTATGGTAVLTFEVPIVDAANGKVRIRALAAASSGLSPKVVWGYAEVYSAPTVYRFFSGRVELRAKGGAV